MILKQLSCVASVPMEIEDTEDNNRTSFEANTESTDVVSKLPGKNIRENDVVLGVLFNGYMPGIRLIWINFCRRSETGVLQSMAVTTSCVHKRLDLFF